MKASELVSKLKKLIKNHGDKEILVEDPYFEFEVIEIKGAVVGRTEELDSDEIILIATTKQCDGRFLKG